MINDLIVSIGRQLNIPGSADVTWVCQIVYSVAGQMALASLWDHGEDSSTVSIQHFKNRIAQIFDAYENLYPQMEFLFPRDRTVLIDEIYSIYLRNGFIYHSPYQITPAVPAMAACGDLVLHRGSLPDAKLCMSGLGFYSVQQSTHARTIASMFGLQEQDFSDYLDELLQHGEWETIEWPDNTEFLKIDPPFNWGYWKQQPEKDDRISLARYGEPNKIFVFYRYHHGLYQQMQIPEWRLRSFFANDSGGYGEYRRIAIALLKRYGTLPEITTTTKDDLVEIRLGYRLPPSEEEFFKLYSWPILFDFDKKLPQCFTRIMTRQVYPMFKHELERIGYCFVED